MLRDRKNRADSVYEREIVWMRERERERVGVELTFI